MVKNETASGFGAATCDPCGDAKGDADFTRYRNMGLILQRTWPQCLTLEEKL